MVIFYGVFLECRASILLCLFARGEFEHGGLGLMCKWELPHTNYEQLSKDYARSKWKSWLDLQVTLPILYKDFFISMLTPSY